MSSLKLLLTTLCLVLLPQMVSSQPKLIREAPDSPTVKSLNIRLIDSETGYAVEPEEVSVRSARSQEKSPRVSSLPLQKGGRFTLGLAKGDYALTVRSQGYQEMTVGVSTDDSSNTPINIYLVPLEVPRELDSSFLQSLHRADSTLIVGFVVDDQRGEPLADVEVSSAPREVRTLTDERGFFALYLPVGSSQESATIQFRAPGYRAQQRQNVELWSNGDWIYRLRLQPGSGTETIDEMRYRRAHLLEEMAAERATTEDVAAPFPKPEEGGREISKASPAVAIPRTIRVSSSTGVDYRLLEDYCKYVLPAEWIPSWGNLAGGLGMNALRAGAVAIRTYAIGFIRTPYASNYDICGTPVCQNYDPSRASSITNDAVNQMVNTVMLNSSGTITFKLTEYSAENNALGLACGDGNRGNYPNCYSDPVCATTARDGHGRGMCQHGSARWASGRYLSSGAPHPYGTKTWQGILNHYYPDLQIAVGQPLAVGDAVKVFGTGGISLRVRECSGGGIGSGTSCPQTGSRSEGQTGIIVSGPQWVLSDGGGYTWWKIIWDGDGLTGWSVENWLERTNPPSDTTAPDTSITGGPSGTVNTSDVTFTYTGSDNLTPTGSLQYAYRLAPIESNFSAFSSQASRSYSSLANGNYTFYVKTQDQAGNQDATPASRSFTVQVTTPDTTPPDTSITGGPSGTINTRDATFTYTGSDNVTPTGSLQYAYRLDPIESSFSAFSSQTSRSYSSLANGNYTFYIKALDQAGNQDTTPASRSFTVQVNTSDTTPPETSITGGPSGTINTRNVTFNWTGSDNVTPTGSLFYSYRLDPIVPNFLPFLDQTSQSFNNLPNGTYTFSVKARDQAGNEDPTTATRSFTVSVTVSPTATPADFNGDGVSDQVVYRSGSWANFSAQTIVSTGGGASCIPAPGDYDGDGDVDFSQLCGAAWHFYNPDGSYIKGISTSTPTGALPVPADYDGDGRTDVVVFSFGAWHFFDYATGGYLPGSSIWTGGNGIPAPMDYDGDGRTDFTLFALGAWHFYNHNGSYNKGIWIGNTPGTLPVPFNRDADPAEEMVLFNGGAFHYWDYETKTYQGGTYLGSFQNPMPSPLDLDGDGDMELTVFANGHWYFYTTEGAFLSSFATGNASDQPISRRLLLPRNTVLLNETFNSYSVGQFPPGWTLYTGDPRISSQRAISGPNSFRFDGELGLGHLVQRPVSWNPQSTRLALEAWGVSERSDSSNVILSFARNSCGDRVAGVLFYPGGTIYAAGPEGDPFRYPLNASYTTWLWRRVRIEVDFTSSTYKVYVDGVLAGQNLPLIQPSFNLICMGVNNNLSSGTGGGTTVYIDDVLVEQTLP